MHHPSFNCGNPTDFERPASVNDSTSLRAAAGRYPACELLRTEGGWSAVLRVPATRSEEQLALDLLRTERILVHPGYFFDFPREAYVVVSLLPAHDLFEDAVARLLGFVNS